MHCEIFEFPFLCEDTLQCKKCQGHNGWWHTPSLIFLFIQTLKQAEDALKAADVTLALKRKQLADVESQVASLKANLKRVEDEMADLQGQVLLTENRLIRAGKLTAALGDEAVK